MDQLQRFRSRPAVVVAACGALLAAVAVADAAKAAAVPDRQDRPAQGAFAPRGTDASYRLTLSLFGAPSRKR
jgi:hypothetical protein